MIGSNDGSTSRIIHGFAQKHRFKGPWDTTGNLVKDAIMRNEAKFNRCANAIYRCLKLLRDLTKTSTENNPKLWEEWEATGDECPFESRTCRANIMIIGLGAVDATKFNKSRSQELNHIVFVDS